VARYPAVLRHEPDTDYAVSFPDLPGCVAVGASPEDALRAAEEALDLLPRGELRVLPGTGFLIAYDDPVGVARELSAFCG